jgi:peptidoglycan/xylan/chitin deacetylase (PgdA/CDA1 family)
LRTLAALPGITIGAHSVDHPKLSAMSEADQRDQLATSKNDLAEMLGAPVTTLAYPHGAFSDLTVRIARELSFKIACTTAGNATRATRDPLRLPRISAPAVDAPDYARFLNWCWRR